MVSWITINTNIVLALGVFVDPPSGQIYVGDQTNNRIVRFDNMSGTNWTTYSTGLNSPAGVFVDLLQRVYVADRNNNRILRFDDMSGTNLTSLAGSPAFSGPFGIFVF